MKLWRLMCICHQVLSRCFYLLLCFASFCFRKYVFHQSRIIYQPSINNRISLTQTSGSHCLQVSFFIFIWILISSIEIWRGTKIRIRLSENRKLNRIRGYHFYWFIWYHGVSNKSFYEHKFNYRSASGSETICCCYLNSCCSRRSKLFLPATNQ